MAVFVDPQLDGEGTRKALFAGDLIVLTRLPAVQELVDHMRAELEGLFAPFDPVSVHEHWSPEEMAARLGEWKPRFIHGARSSELVKQIVCQSGFDPAGTHYDLPKPRTSFPLGHLNTGVAFAFPWHRDAWYSAPPQQLNWWLPVLGARPDNAMAFDTSKFGVSVPNDSHAFDYYAHNAGRQDTAKQVTEEIQSRPGAAAHHAASELVVLPPPGSILLFSGAQLHTSIPNTSGQARFSIDFRTVDVSDVMAGRGAPLADVECTGTSIRDFINLETDEPFDEALVRELFGAPPADAMLVFDPEVSSVA